MNTSMYSQAAFDAAQAAQMTELEERLSGDTTVVAARQKLANAQASLEQLQNQTRTLPYEQRKKWLNDITAQKEAIRDAKKELQVAVNDNAKRFHAAKLEEQRAQEATRLAERQAQFAEQVQAEAKAQYKPSYLASGGKEADYDKDWETTIWPQKKLARADAHEAARHQALKQNSIYSLV